MAVNLKRGDGLPPAMARLVAELSRLPGIGEKTAARLAFNLLGRPREQVMALAEALLEMKERIGLCSECFGLSDNPRCHICEDPARERASLCVVEGPGDLMAIERARSFGGVYHVLGGAIAPLDGVGPDDLKMKELIARITPPSAIQEVIIATNATVEGEATALYIARALKPHGVRTTRLARGLPAGGDLEYSDAATLASALSGRREV
ncbi:MAG: recombination mediator RecR [Candidatus Binataceae bacterium]